MYKKMRPKYVQKSVENVLQRKFGKLYPLSLVRIKYLFKCGSVMTTYSIVDIKCIKTTHFKYTLNENLWCTLSAK